MTVRENYMIIIGIDDYSNGWPILNTAKSDAENIQHILATKYNFQVHEILLNKDATKQNINDKIRSIQNLYKDDNLIIYFAGHGQMVDELGYWIPTDATQSPNSWCTNADLIANIEICPAQHVIVISDSCFSGTILKQSRGKLTKGNHEELDNKSSRLAFVSGGLQKVSDGNRGSGSPFGKNLLQVLRNNNRSSLSAIELFEQVIEMCRHNAPNQEVQWGDIYCEKNQGGQMILRLSDLEKDEEIVQIEKKMISEIEGLEITPKFFNRTVSDFASTKDLFRWMNSLKEDPERLVDVVTEEKKIVLLGTAGSGKSIELKLLARELVKPAYGYIPVYLKLNSMRAEQDFEDFIGTEWQRLDPNILVLILDGLDEIPSALFKKSLEKIQEFSSANSSIRMVISCRSNFYELPDGNYGGMIDGFRVKTLRDLTRQDLKWYIDSIKQNGERFLDQVEEYNWNDIAFKPYFFEKLAKHYRTKGNLHVKRDELFDEALFDKYDETKNHFKNVIDYPDRSKAFSLLEKIAFVAEMLGKNTLTEDEVKQILNSETDFQLLQYLPLLSKNDNGHWNFEHNNHQEHLTAKLLLNLDFEELLKIVAIRTEIGNHIKPSWSNTISFFIAIGRTEKVQKLLDWIVENDPEILIRLEPERIKREVRIEVFQRIFTFYNDKKIWLSSNKFSEAELARFGDFEENSKFLLNLLEGEFSGQIAILNAIRVLESFRHPDLINYKDRIRKLLFDLLASSKIDFYGKHSIIRSLSKFGFTDVNTIDEVLEIFGRSSNQYIRSALYVFLNNTPFINQYADVYFDGLDLERKAKLNSDREDTNLMDEDWNMENGIIQITEPRKLIELLDILRRNRHSRFLYDKGNSLFPKIIHNCINAYAKDTRLFQPYLTFYADTGFGRRTLTDLDSTRFFKETATEIRALNNIISNKERNNFQRDEALIPLINERTIANYIESYRNDIYSDENIKQIFDLINFNSNFIPNAHGMLETLSNAAMNHTGLNLVVPEIVDYIEKKRITQQHAFDFIFQTEDILRWIEDLFEKMDQETLHFDNFYHIQLRDGNALKNAPEIIWDVFREVFKNVIECNKEDVIKLIKSDSFRDLQVQKIYAVLNSSQKQVNVSEKQLEFINSLCKNESCPKLEQWFFIKNYDVVISQKMLMDFVSYSNPNSLPVTSPELELEVLEKLIDDKMAFKETVKQNLTDPDLDYWVWISNSVYALKNTIDESFKVIFDRFFTLTGYEPQAKELLELWYKKSKNIQKIKELLVSGTNHDLKETCYAILMNDVNGRNFLVEFLKDQLKIENKEINEKFSDANLLLGLRDISGFDFLADYILKEKDPAIDYYAALRNLKAVREITVLPKLMLLLELSLQPAFTKDKFNSFIQSVIETIHGLGISSLENFVQVRDAIKDFVAKNNGALGQLDFLTSNILRMQEQLNFGLSTATTIEDALMEFNNIN